MAVINRLTPDTTGKIAAGEVIERPANAVKELIENSIDASARRISVEVMSGGKDLIRVSDDGIGISSEQLPLAVENFATSKITRIEDISRIMTLGFRGEALASIKSVSRLSVSSRSIDEDIGREMKWAGGKLLHDGPVARTQGTEILAEDLFFNVPARKKFLSSDQAELRKITAYIQSLSLAVPDIAFLLKSNGKDVLSYPASSMDERVEVIFGSGTFPNLKRFDDDDGRIRIHGYTSMPGLTRGNRTMQFLFVNRRIIKDRTVSHAIRQAYQSIIPSDRFPLIALFIEISPDRIDVNVHPSKAEIRFDNEREIHSRISSVLRETVGGKTVSFRDKVESVYRTIFPGGENWEKKATGNLDGKDYSSQQHDPGVESTEHRSDWLFQKSPQPLFEASDGDEPASGSGRLYWQLHQSFIFIQIRGGMVIIDQHAAHERILYDKVKNNLSGEKSAVQALLFPATLELSAEEYDNFETLSDTLPSIGFEVEPFGARSVIVRGIPAGVRNWNDGRLLQDILSEKGLGKSSREMLMKSYACRASVKAGDKLSVEEMESLTDQLFATEFPFTCPHGRPTMLRVDMADLERRFQRTVKGE
ncbi:MAG: DNA mismatch repair endonuclease MutL [Candidatus Krumholzibacteria bacterium]|nr:DNA mismatch repair endonuclease MutL [Candidatus Krumholzibacteria bacterium]